MRVWPDRTWSRVFALLALASGGILSQCLLLPEEGFVGELVGNTRPLVRITGGVLEDSSAHESRVHFYWYGADRDGVVRWFEWAIDDTVTEDAWTRTSSFDAIVPFRASSPVSGSDEFTDWHTFFLRAVDNEGMASLADRRYFSATTIAPTTRIASPTPRLDARWASTLRITWQGEDLDGSRPDRLPTWTEYKLVRFSSTPDQGNVEAIKRAFRDSTNVFFGQLSPGDFPADSVGDYFRQARRQWTRVDGTSVSEAWLRSLDVGRTYGFAVRSIDEAGAIEPGFQQNTNWVLFRVANDRIRVTISEASLGSESFNSATFSRLWEVTVAPEQRIRFRWEGDASGTGSEAGPSSYGLDIPDPNDDGYRDANGIGGWIGWGNWAQMREPITFPRTEEGRTHYFYLKMRDITNLAETETDCAVQIKVSRLSFSRKFLIVDDLYFAPSPCVGSPPSDALTDQYRRRVFDEGVAAFLPPGESWRDYSVFRSEAPGSIADIPSDFLDTLGTYQNLIWDSGSSLAVGLTASVRRGHLSRYVGAGGNLLLLVDRGPVSNCTSWGNTAAGPACACEGLCTGSLWVRGSGFLWDLLRLRGCVDKPRDTSGDTRRMVPQTLVRAESISGLYPDLPLDGARWRCGATQRGSLGFEGLVANENEPASDPWYQREVARGGMDLLYRARAFESGASTDSIPIAWRTAASREDSLLGIERGRVVTFAFHPYFFVEGNVKVAMTYALRWVVTGAE